MKIKFIISTCMWFTLLKALTGCSSTSFDPYGYSVHGSRVYYKYPFPNGSVELNDVDSRSFKIISREEDSMYADNTYYATDEKSLWYYGKKVQGGDGPSFQLINVNFAKDKNQCYFRGSIIPGADPSSFVVKNESFSADKSHIFNRDLVVDNDASVFDTFPNSVIVRTKNVVSVFQTSVEIPANATFQHLDFNYFAINGDVYFHDEKLPQATAKHFIGLDNFFSQTDTHVYYRNNIIEGASPSSFRLLESPYSRDDRHIFFFEKMIKGADVNSFEVINKSFQCARDKNAVYHEDKKIEHFTDADLTNKNPCRQCNETNIYFEEKTNN